MFNYFLKRSTIAIHQRRSWFLVPVALTALCILWLYFSSPVKYVISSKYIPSREAMNIQQLDGSSLNEVQLWNLALQELGVGPQFIANKIQHGSRKLVTIMPALINEWAKEKAGDQRIDPRRDRGFKREIIRHIISYLSMEKVLEEGSELPVIEFTYQGDKKILGTKLVGFYSQELLAPWRDDIQKKKSRVESKVRYMTERIEADQNQAIEKRLNMYKTQVRNYDAMLLLLKGTPSAVVVEELDRELSDAIMAQSFYLLILLTMLTLIVIIITEFTGKTFTTEYQVGQYLGIKLIGTIPEVTHLTSTKK